MDVVAKFYYEEVLDENLKSSSRTQALMHKVMEHVQKDLTATFTKHLSLCDPVFGLEFLKQIQLHYDVNSDSKMLTKKLQMIDFA
jgi:UDP-N-acetyl-D-mannosaminuronate dehydrogenase